MLTLEEQNNGLMKEIKELRWQVCEISQENKILNDKFAKLNKM